MIKAEQVPDASAFALDEARRDPDASPWDLIAAALNAWPTAYTVPRGFPATDLVLPIQQENSNERE